MRCFETEILLLHKLDHSHIIRMHEIYEDDSRFYVITDLCQGGELFQHIAHYTNKNCTFPEETAVNII